ncbi:MAG: hypothetical protein V4685_01375 [Bacteroidota bacterium]
MKKFLYVSAMLFLHLQAMAQKQVQALTPTKISVFKNGTYFIRREAVVDLKDNVFYIPAPQNVLMGTWWLAAAKETPIHSIVVKADTIKTEREANDLYGYLQANIGSDITLSTFSFNLPAGKVITGKLLQFNPATKMVKIAQPDGNIIIANAADFRTLETNNKSSSKFLGDSIAGIAKVTVSKPATSVAASTISLETGIQWFPSYLFTPINDKEARLEMKATITNSNSDIKNTSVDIIIGNPEMFYGKQLDPACYNYFAEKIVTRAYDNNYMSMNAASFSNQAIGRLKSVERDSYGGSDDDDQKEGQKSDDLYYYQLGSIDLEQNAKVIVPVNSNTVMYSELYTVSLDENSTDDDDYIPEVYHNYRINNSTVAPFTTGSIFVLNKEGQPVSQSKIDYTPLKGSTEIRLAKAIDVQAKNTEEEIKREKVYVNNTYTDKITYKGNIKLTNYQTKTITVKINKKVDGVTFDAGLTGKYKKSKPIHSYKKNGSIIEWEINMKPGESTDLAYQYYSFN